MDSAKKEKLSVQFALTCASGALMLVGLTTLLGGITIHDLTQVMAGEASGSVLDRIADTSIYKPLKILMLGIPGAFIGGLLGYFVGDMMDNPRGSIPEWYMEQRFKKKEKKVEEPIITGEEMFLDDLEDELDAELNDAIGIDDPF